MYSTNLTHFPDETGKTPKQMPKEARELASFFALVVDTSTRKNFTTLTSTDIRCFKKGCYGLIKTAIRSDNEEIHENLGHTT
jgi:hypothetical protein